VTGARPPAGDPDQLVTVGRYIDPKAAEFARSRLESDGLAAFIQGGGLTALLPIATVFPILLQVRSEDAGRAAEILAELPDPGFLPGEQENGDNQDGPAAGS
jgi:hypothetical protein